MIHSSVVVVPTKKEKGWKRKENLVTFVKVLPQVLWVHGMPYHDPGERGLQVDFYLGRDFGSLTVSGGGQ